MKQTVDRKDGTAPRIDAAAEAQHQTQLADIVNPRYLQNRTTKFQGFIWDVVRDDFSLTPDGPAMGRDYITHPGAVAIVVLNDKNQVLLINQYRQPVGMNLWEIPAGMLDVEGESPLLAAQRELAEETFLTATTWHRLMEYHNSPGCSTEANRVYLARGISELDAADRQEREGEEAEIVARWFDLDEVVQAILASRIHSPSTIMGVLAAHAASLTGFSTLTDPEDPWPAHPYLRDPNTRGSITDPAA
ncbi:NUDIX hydrolase [Rothia nasimurium]|uniref:NUDIX hydrolase n=1 Tax=Rothia nasimurium TaxID=85336 RepID=UPI002DD692DE|nr:NUDIX hydrolase [Rothia nasimurium]